MILKKLELFGFKSFAEKTVLEFEPGITAIVGPNGCGKSNIVDAIKWVIGEQSPRELRGSSMEDVIFSGTQYKERINFAEVSLTLSNESGLLPIDFTEVTITRRLFRGGESEYLINKASVRLKDIQQLIAGTGIGAKTYSLMEQGKIELIINSKPEERRFIFEEASGITKFKIKKKEALRKLENTENNLLRLADVLKEVRRQIGSIERQARKAQKYKALYQQLKECEIQLASLKFQEIDAEIDKLEDEKNILQQSLEQLKAQLQELENEKYQVEAKINTLQHNVTVVREVVTELEIKIHEKKAELKFYEERNNEFKAYLEKAQSEYEKIKNRIRELELEFTNYDSKKDSLKDEKEKLKRDLEIKKEQLENIAQERKELLKSINEIKSILLDRNIERSRKSNLYLELQQESRTVEIKFRRVNMELKETGGELEKKKKEFEELKKELNDNEALLHKKQNFLKQFNDKYRALKSQIDNLDLKEKKIEKEIIKINTKLDLLSQLKERQKIQTMIKHIFHLKEKGIYPFNNIIAVLKDIIKPVPGKERIIKSILGDLEHILLVQDFDSAKALAHFLKEKQIYGIKIIIKENLKEKKSGGVPAATPIWQFLSVLPEIENIKAIFNNVYYIEEIEKVPALLKSYDGLILIVPHGLKFDYCSLEIPEATIEEYEEMGKLTEKLRYLQLQHEELKEKKSNSIKELQGILKQIQDIEKEIKEKNFHLEEYNKMLAQKSQEIKELNHELKLLKEESEELKRELQLYRIKENDFQNNLSAIEAEIKEGEGKIERAQQKISELQIKKEQLLVEIAQCESEIKNFDQRVMQFEDGFTILREEIENQKQQLSKKGIDIVQYQEKLQRLKGEENILLKEIATLTKELTQKKDILKQCEQELSAVFKEQSLQEEKVQPLQEKISMFNEKIHQLALKREQLNHKKDLILERLQQAYGIVEQPQVSGIKEDISQLEDKISCLKKDIESLGQVNLVAIEEYQELRQRLQFLESQEKDLLEAKESLLNAIRKINRTTRQLFEQSFQEIRSAFKEIYSKLFAGGTADLLLEGNKDILEAGIEIVAQPPGKRLQNVNLLSGGEKALTALALLFALFKVKPSPFCILDEVDAPLDETNIDRFRKLMESFAKNSQFLIITHNKLTITTADIIYGITMEDSGVSKIVSVRFREAEKNVRS